MQLLEIGELPEIVKREIAEQSGGSEIEKPNACDKRSGEHRESKADAGATAITHARIRQDQYAENGPQNHPDKGIRGCDDEGRHGRGGSSKPYPPVAKGVVQRNDDYP